MDENWINAVFAYFGEDAPTQDFLDLLKMRCEPTAEELEEIAGVFGDKGSQDDHQYANIVMLAVLAFNDYPEAYIAKLADADPRKPGLVEIAAAKKARSDGKVPSVADEEPEIDDKPAAKAEDAEPDKPDDKPAKPPAQSGLDLMSVQSTSGKKAAKTGEDEEANAPLIRTTRLPSTDNPPKSDKGDKPKGRKVAPAKTDDDREIEKPKADQGKKSAMEDRPKEPVKPVLVPPREPVTQAHRAWLARSEWITLRDSIVRAVAAKDNRQLQTAQRVADGYKAGQRGGSYRLLGQLIELLLADMDAGLPASNPALFRLRYWA